MLIIFDLWGTLLIPPKTLIARIREIPLLEIRDKQEFIRLLEEAAYRKPISLEEGVSQLIDTLILKGYEIKNKEELRQELLRAIRQNTMEAKPRKELREALILARKHAKTAILSNTSKESWMLIDKKYGLSGMVDECFPSFKTGLLKPDLEAFINVISHFKEKAFNTVMIGDSYHSDYLPARMLGMRAVLTKRDDSLLGIVKRTLSRKIRIERRNP